MIKTIQQHGHRGARGLLPENSLPSFAKALSIGVHGLEMDVGITKDNQIVVYHDRRLNGAFVRDSDGKWLDEEPAVNSLSLDEIKQFDIGRIDPNNIYSTKFPNQQAINHTRIPALAEVVHLVQQSGNREVIFNIEAKISPEFPEDTLPAENFAEILVKGLHDLNIAERTLVQCFDWRCLHFVQQRDPSIPTAYLTAQQNWLDNISEEKGKLWRNNESVVKHGSLIKAVKTAGGKWWSPYYRELDESLIGKAHESGLSVITWTVNDANSIRMLADWGVDGIISDYPDLLRQTLTDLGYPQPTPTPVNS